MKNYTIFILTILGLFMLFGKRLFARDTDQLLLARLIFSEAAGESYTGKVAVGWVVRNRVESKKFPDTYQAVIYQSWQFSGVNSPLWNKTYYPEKMNLREKEAWRECLEIAQDVIAGTVGSPIGKADHYYNPDLASPSWAEKMTQVRKIGNHLFLKSQ